MLPIQLAALIAYSEEMGKRRSVSSASIFHVELGKVLDPCVIRQLNLSSWGPFQEMVRNVFLTIGDVAGDIVDNRYDAIRLQRNPEKHGKWPSSPSKFILKGTAHPSCAETSESIKSNLKLCPGCQAVRYCSKVC
jgi:hypothetical protein